ncbi:MAG: class I SAM-dependent methyltransferase [Pseudomonadota bacterium]
MNTDSRQTWSPRDYRESAGFVSELGVPVLDWLAPSGGERILDLGCGDGTLALRLSGMGCEVVGVDSSPEMIEAAKAHGLNAFVCDGHELPFSSEFDAVFSNAALHWMTGPEAVIAGVWNALKPGGRFVGEFGGQGNVAIIVEAIEQALTARDVRAMSPWFFPTPGQYEEMLNEAGFDVRDITLFPRPTPLPGDVGGWLRTFAQPYTSLLPESEREDFIAIVVERLKPKLCDNQGNWTADYVRIRFAAVKPD